jgi:8-oxo-dGTP diphosphatase
MSKHQQFNVGVKGLVVRGGRVLVLRAKDEDFWELPGGRVDKGERIETTLRREIAEELGERDIQVKEIIHAQIGQYPLSPSLRLLLLMFRVHAQHLSRIVLSSEHTDARWIALHELDNLTLPLPDLTAVRIVLQSDH